MVLLVVLVRCAGCVTYFGVLIPYKFVDSLLRHCATSRKVAGSFPGGVIGIPR